MSKKLSGILGKMQEKNMDSLIALKPENIHYITGFNPSSFSLLLLKDEPVLFTSKLDIEAASHISTVPVEELKSLKDIKELLKGKVGIESSMTVKTYRKLSNNFKADITDLIEVSRMVKSLDEIQNVKKALEIAEKSFEDVEFSGTENEVAAKLEYNMMVRGSNKPSFETIVASGKRSSLPHASLTTKEIESPVVVDWGAVYNGYASDTTRTIIETEKQEEIFRIVLEANKKAVSAIKPGVKTSDVDKAARDVIEEYGYGDAYIHSTGHGVGLEIHEMPSLSQKDDTTLEKGMIVTVEPGIYLEGKFGVRVEDMVHVTNRGKVLNKLSHELTF
ncbi:M24 family metallopeptidase [Methanobacterium aggregans]|uniref:M24 family metallopeptidase n=1 Tax=Methanobacterium aggregans TaxID=1615586 RepID=UPI001FDA9796|nr:aminopeptidase P family protein [Methanobacterium aggregans]MBP2046174.1 Xaa-Pro dipeptidase [Methanobacterium aggregans]